MTTSIGIKSIIFNNFELKGKKLKKGFLQILFVLVALTGITACDQMSDENGANSAENKPKAVYKKPKGNKHRAVWDRIRSNFNMSCSHRQMVAEPRVQKFVNHYRANEERLNRISTKATPYLHYIIEELERRNMPGELALLPMIESAFEPQATSKVGAAGLWQFMGGTGREFGLKQDKWYDGRRDITASTKAALDYLEFLHRAFDNNWLLALAAYNAGPGRVQKAIDKNIKAGLPTNFWSLSLPKETKDYVPNFLALAQVIADPQKHDISLPHIENKPYFKPVDPGKHLTFNKVAKLADINVKELKRLNPGYRKNSTHPKGPKQLLLPIENASKLEDKLAEGLVVEDAIPVEPPVLKSKAKAKSKAQRAKGKGKAKARSKGKVKAKIKASSKSKKKVSIQVRQKIR